MVTFLFRVQSGLGARQRLAATAGWLVALSLVVMSPATHADNAPAGAVPPITVYHIEGRRSERIIWFMEELGLPYKLAFIPGDLGASGAAIGAINGMRMAPTVTVADKTLIESSVIMEYLLENYGGGRLTPARTSREDYWRYRRFMYFAEGDAMQRVLAPFFAKWQKMDTNFPYVPRDGFATLMNYLNTELATRPYLAGSELTAADIMMFYPLKLGKEVDGFNDYPNVVAYYRRITARPAFKRALAAANPQGPLPLLAP